MRKEKIITIYPTIIKAGLAISHYMAPDPMFFSENYPTKCSFYLTSLMYVESGKKYTTELNVVFNGKSAISDSEQEKNSMETFMFSHIDDSSILIGSSLHIRDVILDAPGKYDIVFKVYEDIDGNLGEVLDESSSALIAAKPMRY